MERAEKKAQTALYFARKKSKGRPANDAPTRIQVVSKRQQQGKVSETTSNRGEDARYVATVDRYLQAGKCILCCHHSLSDESCRAEG